MQKGTPRMRYDEFRDRWQRALHAAGLLSHFDRPEETIDLTTTARRWEVRLLPRDVEPFSVGATIIFSWGPFASARSYTSEEDLLTELLGQGARRTTQRRLLRVDIAFRARLPYGSTAAMPASDVWVPWVASVEDGLDEAFTPKRRRQAEEPHWRGDLEIAGRTTAERDFCFDGMSVSAFEMVVVPRNWDDPVRREKEPSAHDRIQGLAERYRAALDVWTASVTQLATRLRHNPAEPPSPSPGPGRDSRDNKAVTRKTLGDAVTARRRAADADEEPDDLDTPNFEGTIPDDGGPGRGDSRPLGRQQVDRVHQGTSLFDAFVIVDWSGRSKPGRGKNSIWIGYSEAPGRTPQVRTENPRTRAGATARVGDILEEHVAHGRRVLVGFDFAYGYPAGFSSALGMSEKDAPPWRVTWRLLGDRVQDEPDNANNRFAVAAELNEQIGWPAGPFWGCPEWAATAKLRTTRPAWSEEELPQYRHTERQLRGRGKFPHEVWKLWTKGNVGSQALLGIPRVSSLRFDLRLESHSLVWPFETGFSSRQALDRRPAIVHAEIWPGIEPVEPVAGRVKDDVQVETLVRHFASLDREGNLAGLFDRPEGLTDSQVDECTSEEGWILGA